MRKLFLSLVMLCPLAFANPAPDFAINATELQTTLSQLKGKVVYLDFWASWCKPCRASFPFMNDLHNNFEQQGLVVVAVNLDEQRTDAERFLAQYPADFHITYNPSGSIAEEYQLLGMPSSYLIDKKGQIRFSHQGFFNQQIPRYQQEIQQLLQEDI